MRCIFFTCLFCVYALLGYAQEPQNHAHIDRNLSLRFFVPYDSTFVQGQYIAFNSYTSNIYFQAQKVTARSFSLKSAKDFDIAMLGFVHGYTSREELSTFEHTITDRIIGSAKGKFVVSSNTYASTGINKIYTFLTIENGFGYMVSAGVLDTTLESKEAVNTFFSNVKFSGEQFKEIIDKKETTQTSIFGLITPILILVVVIFIILKLTKRL